jgi:hypothetical protein
MKKFYAARKETKIAAERTQRSRYYNKKKNLSKSMPLARKSSSLPQKI